VAAVHLTSGGRSLDGALHGSFSRPLDGRLGSGATVAGGRRTLVAGRPFGRALDGLVLFFLRRSGDYRLWSVFDITCQISLTPRPVGAENGKGSTFSLRIRARPCFCSD
jgi:hypothetical protein